MSSVIKTEAPKGQKKRKECGVNISMLDPHPKCRRCRGHVLELLRASFVPPLNPTKWDSWEAQASKSKPYAKKG